MPTSPIKRARGAHACCQLALGRAISDQWQPRHIAQRNDPPLAHVWAGGWLPVGASAPLRVVQARGRSLRRARARSFVRSGSRVTAGKQARSPVAALVAAPSRGELLLHRIVCCAVSHAVQRVCSAVDPCAMSLRKLPVCVAQLGRPQSSARSRAACISAVTSRAMPISPDPPHRH